MKVTPGDSEHNFGISNISTPLYVMVVRYIIFF
jgi:hypothetical protein